MQPGFTSTDLHAAFVTACSVVCSVRPWPHAGPCHPCLCSHMLPYLRCVTHTLPLLRGRGPPPGPLIPLPRAPPVILTIPARTPGYILDSLLLAPLGGPLRRPLLSLPVPRAPPVPPLCSVELVHSPCVTHTLPLLRGRGPPATAASSPSPSRRSDNPGTDTRLHA